VITAGNLGNTPDPIVKSVFLYLVKEMKIPKALQLIWFHLFGNKKDIVATRFNISAILSFFVTNVPKTPSQ